MMKRIALLLLVLLVGLGAAWQDDLFELRKQFEIFGKTYEMLATDYVEEVEPAVLVQAGIDAMLEQLDPYTTYSNAGEQALAQMQVRGDVASVGLELARREGRLVVIAPAADASAYRQGIRRGDAILQIGGEPTEELTMRDAQTLLSGDEGTTVDVVVRRAGREAPLRFTLKRTQPSRSPVSYAGRLESIGAPGVGYVRLERFTANAAEELRSALDGMDPETLEGLVLDLRANPGGLLNQAVEIVGLFVEPGTDVVRMRGRTDAYRRQFVTQRQPLLPELPLAVVVDEHSASASEIVAGALQDLDRAVVVGRSTYGKGLVQKVEQLPYNAALKLTVARYYTPSGRSIQRVDYPGIPPEELADDRRYTTQAGRPVEGGGGIHPDREVRLPQPGEYVEALQRQAAFFRFADAYASEEGALASEYGRELVEAFQSWVDREGIQVETQTERLLDSLAVQAEVGGYAAVEGQLPGLRSALRESQRELGDEQEAALLMRLRDEVLRRYVAGDDLVRRQLPHDPEVEAALDLLRDESAYRAILTP